jgi:putative ABC transport system permease protein
MHTFFQDVRYALRQLRKNPGFATVAVLTLALGIGANTVMFTVVNGVLLRPLSFPQPDRLFLISSAEQGQFNIGPSLSDHEYLDFRAQDRLFQSTASFAATRSSLTGAGDPVQVPAANVTLDFFATLGVFPKLGRSFLPREDSEGRDSVVVLSDRIWKERFGADPHILRRKIKLDGVEKSVIGVMPSGFTFPYDADLWTPFKIELDPHNSFSRPVLGRLRSGVSVREAQAELETLVQRWPIPPGEIRKGVRTQIIPLKELLVGNVRRSLLVFSGAVAFVLLIACVNVANLFLVRISGRAQELAVRSSLGAGQWRLIRQALTESAVISFLGAAASLFLTVWGLPVLIAVAPAGTIPRIGMVRLDVRVIVFTFLISAVVGLAAGLLPAFRVTRRDLRAILSRNERTTTGRKTSTRHTLAISQIALAMILLICAGLLLKSYIHLRNIDPGFTPQNTLTMTVDLPDTTYHTVSQLQTFDTRVLEALSRIPGALAAGAVNWRPLGDALVRGDFQIEGSQRVPPHFMVDKPSVSSGYFKTMGIRLLKGRDFSEHDNGEAAGVAIVSESLARTLWPGQNVVGKRVSLEDNPKPADWLTIVGVVADVHQQGLNAGSDPAIYQPYLQVKRPFFLSQMTFVVRTSLPSSVLVSGMRSVLREIDKDQPASIASMETIVATSIAEPRFQARLLGLFAAMALSLAIVGIYGVLSNTVGQRIHEIGVRLALGAQRRDLFQMLLREALFLACIGIVFGIAGALVVTRVLRKFLFEVRTDDPLTFLLVGMLLLCAALAAGTLPARRAMNVDPMEALRYE